MFLEGDPASGKLSRQPLVAVNIHLHREGEPSLELHVHQAEFAVHPVEVDDQADAVVRRHLGTVLAVLDAKGAAGFHRPIDAYEALGDAVSLGQLASVLLHRLRPR